MFQPIHSVLPHGNTNDNCPNPYTVCCLSAYPAPQRSLPSEWPAHMLLCQNRAAQIISTFSRGETAPCPPESFRPSLGKASLPTARPCMHPPSWTPNKSKGMKDFAYLPQPASQTAFAFLSMCEVELSFMTVMFKSRTVPFLQQRIP